MSEATERLEAALRKIIAHDEVENPGFSASPDYWCGIGLAADIARDALGIPRDQEPDPAAMRLREHKRGCKGG